MTFSLRTKLISLVTLILVTGFGATNFMNYEVSKNAMRVTILENELPLSSNNVYSEIQSDLLRPIFISSLMANDTFVHDWIGEGEMDPDRMVRYLEQIRDRYNATTSYFISANTLRYYHFSGVGRELSKTNPEDNWFFESASLKEPYAINVDNNYQIDDNITIFINYRVEDRFGKFIGITGVGLGLGSVSKLVKAYEKQFRRSVYFVDDNGQIQVHADPKTSGKINIRDVEGLSSIADEVLTENRGSHAYNIGFERMLLTTRYIPELKWHLFIEMPESQALANIKEGFIRNLVIGPAVILLTLLLIVYTINNFQRRLETMAITDKLTGLNNRQHFDVMLEQAIKRFHRDQQTFSLLVMDIDHFKPINDTMGHLAGDKAIQHIADVIRSHTRESDILCRWGGEEFVIMAPACTADEARRLGDSIRDAMRESTVFINKPEYEVTLSVGITQCLDSDTKDSLVGRADSAMYKAKENGRDRTETT